MIVPFRLIWCLIRARFKPKVDVLDESSITLRVWPNDLDANMHMTAGRYQSMMDFGRVSTLAYARLTRKVFGRGWRPIAAAVTIRYRRSLLPFQRFTVRTRVVCWTEKWFYFRHVLESRGEVCAIGYVRGLLRGRKGNVPSAEFLELAGKPGVQSPPMPEDIARWEAVELR